MTGLPEFFPKSCGNCGEKFWNTGKKSNPPSWQQQLVRVARAGKAWGPLIRSNFLLSGSTFFYQVQLSLIRSNFLSLDKKIVVGILIYPSLKFFFRVARGGGQEWGPLVRVARGPAVGHRSQISLFDQTRKFAS